LEGFAPDCSLAAQNRREKPYSSLFELYVCAIPWSNGSGANLGYGRNIGSLLHTVATPSAGIYFAECS